MRSARQICCMSLYPQRPWGPFSLVPTDCIVTELRRKLVTQRAACSIPIGYCLKSRSQRQRCRAGGEWNAGTRITQALGGSWVGSAISGTLEQTVSSRGNLFWASCPPRPRRWMVSLSILTSLWRQEWVTHDCSEGLLP